MPFTIEARLRSGIYEAAATNSVEREWPPAPARVFSALTAAAQTDAEWAALRDMESLAEPEVWADEPLLVSKTGVAGYVVNNKTELTGAHQTWPWRKSALREKVGTVTASGRFALVYRDDVDAAVLKTLSDLAWKVPYLGRSTGDCELAVHDGLIEQADEWVVWGPFNGTGSPPGMVSLPAPYPGYLGALQAAYAADVPAHSVGRARPYVPVSSKPESEGQEAVRGPFSDMMVFGLEDPRGRAGAIPGEMAGTVAEVFRNAVLKVVADPVPPAVSGKDADDQTHVAYLPLLNVGNDHADGSLMGIAVAIPAAMTPADRRALVRPLLPTEPDSTEPAGLPQLFVDRYVQPRLVYRTEHEQRGLTLDRWTRASNGGTRDWVSVTPVMLSRYVKKRDREEDEIARSLEEAGYPPCAVRIMPRSPVQGAPSRIEFDKLLAKHPGRARPLRHCRVRFEQPVIGPVIAGRLRYRGIGLFIPDTTTGNAKERRAR